MDVYGETYTIVTSIDVGYTATGACLPFFKKKYHIPGIKTESIHHPRRRKIQSAGGNGRGMLFWKLRVNPLPVRSKGLDVDISQNPGYPKDQSFSSFFILDLHHTAYSSYCSTLMVRVAVAWDLTEKASLEHPTAEYIASASSGVSNRFRTASLGGTFVLSDANQCIARAGSKSVFFDNNILAVDLFEV